jgi:hypothetical protein
MIVSLALLVGSLFFYPQTKSGLGLYTKELSKAKSEETMLRAQSQSLKETLGDSPYKARFEVGPANLEEQVRFVYRIKDKAQQESLYLQNIRVGTNNFLNIPQADATYRRVHSIQFTLSLTAKDYEGMKRFLTVFDEFPFEITAIKINYPMISIEGQLFGR